MRAHGWICPAIVVAWAGVWATAGAAARTVRGPSGVGPTPLSGATEVEPCAWPSVVALDTGCTGTLIAPEVVLFAAHCADPARVRFGDDPQGAGRVESVRDCVRNPDWQGPGDVPGDWAACRLARPVHDIPVIPVAYGCERSALTVGAPATMVGVGQPSSGHKRWVATTITATASGAVSAGGAGVGGCPGDSGGPLMVEMADGTWRLGGILSSGLTAPGCERGGTGDGTSHYARGAKAIPRLEDTLGLDLTPCHDPEGRWEPGPDCGGFSAQGPQPTGDSANNCSAWRVGGPSETCGPAHGVGEGTSGVPDPQTGSAGDDTAGAVTAATMPEPTESSEGLTDTAPESVTASAVELGMDSGCRSTVVSPGLWSGCVLFRRRKRPRAAQ